MKKPRRPCDRRGYLSIRRHLPLTPALSPKGRGRNEGPMRGCEHVKCPCRETRKIILRKEVIQPQVPLRLPCYDLVPIDRFIFGAYNGDFGCPDLSWLDGRCVQGSGTHSPQCC